LTGDELKTLTEVTQQSKKRYLGDDWQFTANDRTMLYTLAAFTGLRASELASLTKSSFNFEANTFTLEAASAKNRKRTTLPLHPMLSEKLQTWFVTLKRDVLCPGRWAQLRMGGKMLKRDLKRAGIAYRDADGRCVDFHALRYTFITSLAKAGVHPAKAQRLARHSSITLTMNVYTSLEIDDLRDSVNSLPFSG
jgi:integrase